MRALPEKFEELEELLLHHRATLAQNTGVPFVRLVYRPEEEAECRRRRELLEKVLKQKGTAVERTSCQGVIFTHYEQRDRVAQLFELERSEGDRLSANIANHARQQLVDQLLGAAERLKGDGVIFLEETAFVYPYLHLAPVLDDCINRITPPMALVVFYPADVDVDGQVMFLGVRQSGYYRSRDLI